MEFFALLNVLAVLAVLEALDVTLIRLGLRRTPISEALGEAILREDASTSPPIAEDATLSNRCICRKAASKNVGRTAVALIFLPLIATATPGSATPFAPWLEHVTTRDKQPGALKFDRTFKAEQSLADVQSAAVGRRGKVGKEAFLPPSQDFLEFCHNTGEAGAESGSVLRRGYYRICLARDVRMRDELVKDTVVRITISGRSPQPVRVRGYIARRLPLGGPAQLIRRVSGFGGSIGVEATFEGVNGSVRVPFLSGVSLTDGSGDILLEDLEAAVKAVKDMGVCSEARRLVVFESDVLFSFSTCKREGFTLSTVLQAIGDEIRTRMRWVPYDSADASTKFRSIEGGKMVEEPAAVLTEVFYSHNMGTLWYVAVFGISLCALFLGATIL